MGFYSPDRNGHIGMSVTKKILMPLLVVVLFFTAIDYAGKVYQGKKLCKKMGYIHCTYMPAGQFGDGEEYFFEGMKNPDGTIDQTATLVIDIDQ